jgi:hypothetical protein
MNLSLFRVLSQVEQEAMRALADRERWVADCVALGASREALLDYDARATAYARTTIYPNSRMQSEARRAALEALQRGETLPADPEVAIKELWARDLARLLPR